MQKKHGRTLLKNKERKVKKERDRERVLLILFNWVKTVFGDLMGLFFSIYIRLCLFNSYL